MKKVLFYMLPIWAFMMASCHDGDSESNSFENNQFFGEWYLENSDRDEATDLIIYTGSFKGAVYKEVSSSPKEHEKISGMWTYSAKSNILVMQTLYSSTGNMSTDSWKVLALGDHYMNLKNQDFGTEEKYYKVVKNVKIYIGEEISIDNILNEKAPVNFVSSGKSIINVSSDGVIKAIAKGVAFILVSSDNDTFVVKVSVESRVDEYMNQVGTDIDDFIFTNGEPDASGMVGENPAILYNEPAFDTNLSAIQYQYDDYSREITRIVTVYKDENKWQSKYEEIQHSYKDYGYGMFGIEDEYYLNEKLISPFESEGSYYVSYQNYWYYSKNGHY